MKKLKSLYQICYVALTILSFCHCSTKNLTTQKSRTATSHAEDISIQTSESGAFQGSRIIAMSDSVNQQYRINIFPLDTFSFSLQNGFKGKASMIEVVGTRQEVKKITDSNTFRAERQDETQYDSKSRSRVKTFNRDKSLEKRKSNIIVNILSVITLGVLMWLVWRKWKSLLSTIRF